jgi:hypothetical protein
MRSFWAWAALFCAFGLDDGAVVAPAAGAVPLGDGFVRPLRGLVVMAAVAGVGHPQPDAQIRPRDPKTVVGPIIDHHVGPLGHVALGTLGPGAHREQNVAIRGLDRLPFFPGTLVEVVRFGVVDGGPVALQAQRIALLDPFLMLCTSWQSLQRTLRRYILLWVKEP